MRREAQVEATWSRRHLLLFDLWIFWGKFVLEGAEEDLTTKGAKVDSGRVLWQNRSAR